MPSELLDRVRDLLTEDPATTVMNGIANWAPGWGGPIRDVKTVVPHLTAGWPPRSKAQEFVRRYTVRRIGATANNEVIPCPNCPGNNQGVAPSNCSCLWGIGPMYYLSYDGTIARLVSNVRTEARVTYHAMWVNTTSVGVETGNLFRTAPPPGSGWVRVAQNPAGEDLPGANLFLRDMRDNPREVIACWWTTANYAGPAREHTGAGLMLFSEAQYRSWALLGRFLAEQFAVPRNLPLLPWAARSANVTNGDNYRRIALADPAFDAITSRLQPAWQMNANMFAADPAGLNAAYAALAPHGTIANPAWTSLFTVFRGFHGHDVSGANNGQDHDCPGPLFDWHRFARELWDWWWYPFDVAGVLPTSTTTATPQRGYQRPDASTPLVEHYFDDDNQNDVLGTPLDARHADRSRDGIQGVTSAPATWRLDQGSPVYAMANGELVAARFAQPNGVVSMSFVLVRHLIFHRTVGGADPVRSLRLDYDQAASTVYSLYMHIGHPADLDLTKVNIANPDWLNRVHVRKKECDLGVTFYNDPTHHGLPAAAWNQPLPGLAARPTLADGWRIDQAALTTFLADLAAGRVAMAPYSDQTTPIRIILGDYLGNDGVVASVNGTQTRGIRVEVFSPQALPGFTLTGDGASWTALPPGFAGTPVQQFPSEWARDLSDADKAALTALGVDVTLVTWWPTTAQAMALDPRIIAADRLPADGQVFHYQTFDFLRWINKITWNSEWPKHQVLDAAGHAQAAPPQPRSRRV